MNPADPQALIRQYREASACLDPGPRERQALLAKFNHYIERFLAELSTRPAFITTRHQGSGLYDSPIGEQGMDIDTVLDLFRRNVDDVGLSPVSPRFLAYIPPCSMYQGALADFLASVTNKFAGDFSNCPGAVRMENQLLRWMADLVGYPADALGTLVSGGSVAILSAVITARDARGLKARDYERAVAYMTDHTHHAMDKALRIAGMAECVRRRVGMDSGYRMDPEALDQAIQRDKRDGMIPWLVAASSGTTNLGAVDPLAALADVAARYDLWYHVDGAFGALFVLSELVRDRFAGIERSDSVVMNPHKALFTPFGLAAVLVRDGQLLYQSHYHTADYLQDTRHDKDEMSPADLGPELTRHFRGPRLWFPLKLLGVAPFRAALSEKILLARHAYERLRAIPGIETGPYPDLSVFVFRYLPRAGNADEFNRRLVEDLRRDGTIMLSSTLIENRYMIRFAVLSFRTHVEEIELAIGLVLDTIRKIEDSA